MNQSRLYLSHAGEVTGPHEFWEVSRAFHAGELLPDTLASYESAPGWIPVPHALGLPTIAPAAVSPRRASSLGRLADNLVSMTAGLGFSAFIIVGVGLMIAGIPLLAFVIGFIMVPVGFLMTVLGIVGFLRS